MPGWPDCFRRFDEAVNFEFFEELRGGRSRSQTRMLRPLPRMSQTVMAIDSFALRIGAGNERVHGKVRDGSVARWQDSYTGAAAVGERLQTWLATFA